METENVTPGTAEGESPGNFRPKKKRNGVRARKIRRAAFIVCMLAWPVLQFCVSWVYVNFDTVLLTFRKYVPGKGYSWADPWYVNYQSMFETFSRPYNALKPALRNSLLYFPFNNFILLPVSLICAYLLYKKVLGAKAFRVVFFFPSVISAVVLTLIFGFMLSPQFGPVNSVLKSLGLGGVIPADGWLGSKSTAQPMIFLYCLWAGIGYNVVLFSGAMQRVPAEILESARIDGVGMTRELVQIMIPIIFPTITTLFIQGCTVVFTLFMQPMLLTGGGPNNETMTIAYYIVNLVKSGAPRNLIDAATVGIFFSVIGVPVIFGIKALLEKITPQVEY